MAAQPFTPGLVRAILELSEGTRASGTDGGVGHAGSRHVSITNAGLAERLRDEQQAGGIAVFTAFLSFNDQIAALTQVLNLPEVAARIENFERNVRPGQRFGLSNITVPTPMRMRYGQGDGARTFPCRDYSLFLRKDVSRPRGMHVVSFFGTMGRVV